MFTMRSKSTLVSGCIAILLLILAAISVGYKQLNTTLADAEQLIQDQSQKVNLLMSMHTSVQGRYAALLRAFTMDNPFKRDKQLQLFSNHAVRYIASRSQLASLIDNPREKHFLEQQKTLSNDSAALLNKTAELLKFDEDRSEAMSLFLNQALPSQQKFLVVLEDMLEYQKIATQQSISQARKQRQQTIFISAALLLLALIIASIIVVTMIRRLEHARDALYARVTLESIADAVIATDASGLINYANPQAEILLGCDESKLLGKSLQDIVQCPNTATLHTNRAEKPKKHIGECRLQTKDNHTLHIEYSVAPIEDLQQQTLGSVMAFRDISERKTMKKELREYDERFTLIMQGTNDGIWDYNLMTGEIYYSPRWKRMLGYAEEELDVSFTAWQERAHPEDLGHVLDIWTNCMTGKSNSFTLEYRMKNREGNWLWFESRGIALQNDSGDPIRLAGSDTNITDRKESEQRLRWQSTHDQLTNLANRYELNAKMEDALVFTNSHNCHHAFLYIDIDQFKVINDTCGHVAGDELLRQIASLLADNIRDSDTLARLGSDEFGILLIDCPADKALSIASALCTSISEHWFVWDNSTFRITASIGSVNITRKNASSKKILSTADLSCHSAKELGGNRVCLYQKNDEHMSRRYQEMNWVTRITDSLKENRFVLYQQQIQPIGENKNQHQEILLRMLDEKGSVIPPGEFIPAAERYNLMPAIDRWVITTLLKILAATPSAPGMVTTVNLSGTTFNQEGFIDFVKEQFQQSGVDPTGICFEITETAAIANFSSVTDFIHEIKMLGCLFALDDFGTGLSSFAYLKNLPVDYLKIDGEFVKGIAENPIDAAMVKSINEVGHVMNMKTIAEFVENDAILAVLTEIGVDYAQGYGIAMPCPFEQEELPTLQIAR